MELTTAPPAKPQAFARSVDRLHTWTACTPTALVEELWMSLLLYYGSAGKVVEAAARRAHESEAMSPRHHTRAPVRL